MPNIKRVVCVQSIIKHRALLNLLKDKYPDIHIIASLDLLKKEINSNLNADINIAFIDIAFANEIMKEMKYQFNFDNTICIIISEDPTDSLMRQSYIYDILEYKTPSTVNHFLRRLEKNIDYRVQLLSATSEIREFYRIGQKINSEKNVNALMELFIDASINLTSADAGSLYIIVDNEGDKIEEWSTYEKNNENKYLKFVIAKNRSIELGLQSSTIPILNENIVGYTVLNDKATRVDDVYDIPSGYEYKYNPKFDDLTGYRTKSMLTVPMKDQNNRILGVIQLINKKQNEEIVSFTFKDELTIYSLAGQASIALENNALYRGMENLLEKYRQTINDEITKRRQTDEEVNKLLSAVEHSPSTVLITDVNGNILYTNPKFTELTGYEYKEVIGKNPSILKSGDHNNDFYEQFWETITSGNEWRGEFKNKKKNGEIYWESASVSSLKDNNGVIKYFIAVKEDMTDKKLMNEQLESKNAELEKAIGELKKTQAHLIQKEKMVGIGQLAAGIAHEVNNPLGFILSNTRTLKKYMSTFKELVLMYKKFIKNNIDLKAIESLDQINYIKQFEEDNNLDFLVDDLVELFNDTNTGLEKVKEIVDALRRFATIDQLNECEEYSLNQGIKDSILVFRHDLSNVIINEELNDIPTFMAIGGEINQAILNLISNAIYSIKQKNDNIGKIDIKTWYKEDFVYCEIEDNGEGIEKENNKDIFNPFYTTKPEGQGMGLGLTIAYDIIVKRHSGEILVDSQKGIGAKFTFKIPTKLTN